MQYLSRFFSNSKTSRFSSIYFWTSRLQNGFPSNQSKCQYGTFSIGCPLNLPCGIGDLLFNSILKKSFLPVFIGRLFNIICPCNPHATAFQTFNPAISVRRILVPDNPPIFQRVTFTGLVTLAKHIIFSFLIFLFLFYGYYTRF